MQKRTKGLHEPWGWKNALYIEHTIEAILSYSDVIAEPDPRQPGHMTNKEKSRTDKCYEGYEMERNVLIVL